MLTATQAGGMPTLLHTLRPLLHLDTLTITGRTLGAELDALRPPFVQDIVRPLSDPLVPCSSLVVLRGNLAPDGCVLKQSAMSASLREHRGRAVVFHDVEDLMARIDDPGLDVDASSVLVLQNAGPVGHPGMPEAGMLPIPKKLARIGVKDMLRISDSRMSGTASGAVVLHIAPESAVGGPLAVVRDGDEVEVSVEERRITLCVPQTEIDARLDEWGKVDGGDGGGTGRGRVKARKARPKRGYAQLYHDRVLQADQGADFDFLRCTGSEEED